MLQYWCMFNLGSDLIIISRNKCAHFSIFAKTTLSGVCVSGSSMKLHADVGKVQGCFIDWWRMRRMIMKMAWILRQDTLARWTSRRLRHTMTSLIQPGLRGVKGCYSRIPKDEASVSVLKYISLWPVPDTIAPIWDTPLDPSVSECCVFFANLNKTWRVLQLH